MVKLWKIVYVKLDEINDKVCSLYVMILRNIINELMNWFFRLAISKS
ncbi:MAG: hypothetical protein K6357_05760 [Elusimicrobiota bacterium]